MPTVDAYVIAFSFHFLLLRALVRANVPCCTFINLHLSVSFNSDRTLDPLAAEV